MGDIAGSFSFPTRVELGAGKVKELAEILRGLGIERPLVVTDAGFANTEAFGGIRQGLDASPLDWSFFSDVHSNPLEQDVRGALATYRDGGCDGVVGLGGGSPLDVAKAMRLLIKRPDLKLSEFDWLEDWSRLVPLVAIPTTAGTGSEVGRSAVITPEATQRKAVLFHPALLASVAILDPELTLSLPSHLTAATGFDALTHCVESFTSPVFHPLCDGIALEGIRLLAQALPAVMANPQDVEARAKLLIAAAMGGIAFQKDLGAAHSMAHPLSTLHGMHHGLANALCLPTVMRFNAERAPGVYRQVALALGADVVKAEDAAADDAAIDAVSALLQTLQIDPGLGSRGIGEDHLAALADEAVIDPCHQTNPVPVSREDFVALYRNAL